VNLRTAPHSRRNSRSVGRLDRAPWGLLTVGQTPDLVERRTDELDVGRLTYGFDAAQACA
jgi:hypothetical protein